MRADGRLWRIRPFDNGETIRTRAAAAAAGERKNQVLRGRYQLEL